MAEAPATMVTDTQVVVNVEGPAVAGEGARTFFAVSLMCWRKSPLAAPGVALAGATGATGARGSGLRGPSTRDQPPRATARPALHSRTPAHFSNRRRADDDRLCRLCLLCAVQG